MKNIPIKRHKALQPLSRDHHHGLLLSGKIRAGFSKNIEPLRIKNYADWFFKNHLIPHFEITFLLLKQLPNVLVMNL